VGVSGVSRRVEGAGGRAPLEVGARFAARFTARSAARFAMLLALCGQLAALVHVVLVAHVTCGADGELVHVSAGRSPAPAIRDAARPAAGAARDEHDHCLLDEEGEAVCPAPHVASGEPVLATHAAFTPERRDFFPGRRAHLYRLAPKNSPPA